METQFLKLAFLACMVSASVTSCNFSTEQKAETLEKAKANVVAASEDLDIARLDSAEYAVYRIESEKKLRENELLIADMKDKMKSERKESWVKYEKQLDSLDMQNSRLRINVLTYRAESRVKWDLFKANFNRDLDALGKFISQMAERNMKKG
ncbi:MAG: hypothetical protein WCR72_08880 [Bacteroidota bacterium]